MKKTLLIFIIIIGTSVSSLFAAEHDRNLLLNKVDLAALETKLILNQEWVKYPKYMDRAGCDALTVGNKDALIKEGEKYLDYKWQVVRASDYLDYKRTGIRKSMENPYNANTVAISHLLLAELAEGKGRFMDQLINGVFQACEMTSWVLSAHVVVQKTRSSLPNHNEQVIDLVSGDVGSLLSWTYYFMKDEFDKVEPYIAERLRTELQNKILTPYMERDDYWWMALSENRKGALVNNWNPWCNSNVLQCLLLLENDPKILAEGVYKSMKSVDKFINYVQQDGACEEGPAYWGHAAGKLYDYLQILYDGTNGGISLFDEPLVKDMGEYISRSYVGDGWVVNFADASARMTLGHDLIFRYGKAVGSKEMQEFGAYLKSINKPKSISVSRDMFRSLESLYSDGDIDKVVAVHNNPTYTWYPQTEFCYIKKGNTFFAAKGGFNNESHNHNDIGTFSFYIDNQPIFIDAGVGTYTRQTFSNERYTIWSMQSDYHNLPQINGYQQQFGAKYKARNTKLDKKNNKFSLDIAGAYPEAANVTKWQRSYQLKDKSIEIKDVFAINGAEKPNQVNFMVQGNVDLSKDGIVTVEVEGKTVQLQYDSRLFAASMDTVELEDPRLSKVWGNQIYRVSLNAQSVSDKGEYKFLITY